MIPNFFKDNKYTKWYFSIVSNPSNSADYYEVHHIIPKSMGGGNSKDNLVRLSARQHFVVHKLLTKMVDGPLKKKAEAAFRCCGIMKSPVNPKEKIKLKSWDYEKIRKNHSQNMRDTLKLSWKDPIFREKMSKSVPTEIRSARAKLGRTEETIKLHRSQMIGRKHTPETKEKMAIARRKKFEDPEYKAFICEVFKKGLITIQKKAKQRMENRLKEKLEKPIKYNWKLTSPKGDVNFIISINAFCKDHNLIIGHLIKYMKLGQAVPCGKKHRFGKHQAARKNTEGWKLERL